MNALNEIHGVSRKFPEIVKQYDGKTKQKIH